MNKPSGNFTHPQYAVDPKRFRAQATGIGQTQSMSFNTGSRRAQKVIDSVPPHCRDRIPPAEGYPEPMTTSSDFVDSQY